MNELVLGLLAAMYIAIGVLLLCGLILWAIQPWLRPNDDTRERNSACARDELAARARLYGARSGDVIVTPSDAARRAWLAEWETNTARTDLLQHFELLADALTTPSVRRAR